MDHVGALALVGSGEYLPGMAELEGALLKKALSVDLATLSCKFH